MRYYVKIHSIQGKNSLQKALIQEAEKWDGTLIEDEEAKKACITHMLKVLDHFNRELSKCKPCHLSVNKDSISFTTYIADDTFVILTFHRVRFEYDGIMRYKEK